MPKPISRSNWIKKLKLLGFIGPFSGGKHQYMERNNFRIAIPNSHGKDIGSALLSKMLHDIGVSSKEFNKLK